MNEVSKVWRTFCIVLICVLVIATIFINSAVRREFVQARRIETELNQAVSESIALTESNSRLESTVIKLTSELEAADTRVGELSSRIDILAADNIRALGIVDEVTRLSVGLASGVTDIEELGRELADEINRALTFIRELQEASDT